MGSFRHKAQTLLGRLGRQREAAPIGDERAVGQSSADEDEAVQ
jgi:hypothetical protein